MVITRDALLRVIKAARMSIALADDMRKLLVNEHGCTVADEISGFLNDALFYFCGERLTSDQDFKHDSATMQLLTSSLSDEDVLDEFIQIYETTWMPAPQLMEKEEFRKLFKVNGGYMRMPVSTPEGERK